MQEIVIRFQKMVRPNKKIWKQQKETSRTSTKSLKKSLGRRKRYKKRMWRNKYKNMPEENKQKLNEYGKGYCSAKKKCMKELFFVFYIIKHE